MSLQMCDLPAESHLWHGAVAWVFQIKGGASWMPSGEATRYVVTDSLAVLYPHAASL